MNWYADIQDRYYASDTSTSQLDLKINLKTIHYGKW